MTYRMPEEMHTPRCVMRRAQIVDAEEIFEAYATDAAVTRFLCWRPHSAVNETQRFLRLVDIEWQDNRGFAFVIRGLQERLLGMMHAHVSNRGVSYGYVLRRDIWGQGIASEVLRTLVEHALLDPSVYRTFAFCDVENLASTRVMEKAGMQREGVLRRYFVHPNISHEPRDCFIYARVR